MLSWHGLRLEAVCGMGCEEARGTVREKQGGVLVLARDRGQRKRGQGGRTHVEPHHDLCSRGFFMVVDYLWLAGTAGGGWSITWRAWGIFGEEYVLFVTDV